MTNLPLAFGMPGVTEWIIIAVLGLLFFGKRLPEVGRSLGRGIVEFKKGLKGVEDEIETATSTPEPRALRSDPNQSLPDTRDDQTSSQPRFDPYTGRPLQTAPQATPRPAFDPYTGKPLT